MTKTSCTTLLLFFLFSSCSHAYRLSTWRSLTKRNNLFASVADEIAVKSGPVGVSFDGSSGSALSLKDVSVAVGNYDILNSLDWEIMPKERWGIVGKNGAGKSTLLRTIINGSQGNINIQSGSINIAKKSRIGYLEQKGVSGSTLTLREEVVSRMDRLRAATQAYEIAEAKLTNGDTSDEALTEFESASEEYEAAGGYTVEQKIGGVLKGLGFLEEDYDRKCSEFSGGWQMRIALARLLLSEPDLLILDEPTNHLDAGARNWLGTFLANYESTLIVVSHDESLLQAAVSSIAEVKAGRLELYKSRSYSQWQVEREERVKLLEAAAEKNQAEIDRLQGFVDRFGAKTMGAKAAQSNLKMIEKLQKNAPDVPVDTDDHRPVLKLPIPPRGTQHLLSLEGVKLAWDANAAANNHFIINRCDVRIERGMRWVVRGPNGAGKSTFLSALSGKLSPNVGTRVEGDGLALGVFTQDLAQDLDQEATAVEVVTRHVREYDPSLSDERARSVLGALGLTGEKSLRKVGNLSGGEKARVALASFVLIPHNLLLLDEPSNHLDVATLDVLTNALREFAGSIVVISHDRGFVERLDPTHVVTVRDGQVGVEQRALIEDDWDVPLLSRVAEPKFAPITEAPTTPAFSSKSDNQANAKSDVAASSGDDNETRKAKMNAPKVIKKLENNITKWEEKLMELDDEMIKNGKDVGKLSDLQKEKDKINEKIEKLYADMEIQMEFL